ncbi:MAG: Xaa-Pro peptidase family protein [Thaumarchaeota archaeon]|nr:Xaa-Pro peptidase family protein [Nitrososphaerota archaeon]
MLVNKERVDRFLDELQLDGLIATSRENTTYLTDFLAVNYILDQMKFDHFSSSGDNFLQTYGIYTKGSRPALVIPVSMFMSVPTDGGVLPEVFTYGRPFFMQTSKPDFDTLEEKAFFEHLDEPSRNFASAADALSGAVKEFMTGEEVGVDFSDLHPSSKAALEKKNRLRLKNAKGLFKVLRLVKSGEEVARLKASAEMNERALNRTFEAAKTGVSELELRRVYARSIVSEDGDFDTGHFIVGSGTKSGAPLGRANNRKLAKGSILKLDVTSKLRGYYADTGDTGIVGRPTKKQERVYEALGEAVRRSEELAVPGTRPSELHREVLKVWDKYAVERPPTGMGHGIGLEVHEYPVVSDPNSVFVPKGATIKDDLIDVPADAPLEEGMVLNLEAPYLMWGIGGIHLEHTVLLGKRKSRPLTKQERHLRLLS